MKRAFAALACSAAALAVSSHARGDDPSVEIGPVSVVTELPPIAIGSEATEPPSPTTTTATPIYRPQVRIDPVTGLMVPVFDTSARPTRVRPPHIDASTGLMVPAGMTPTRATTTPHTIDVRTGLLVPRSTQTTSRPADATPPSPPGMRFDPDTGLMVPTASN